MMTKKELMPLKRKKTPWIAYLPEAIGWLQIVAAPLLLGLFLGAVIYFSNPSTLTLLLCTTVALVGLALGIKWATKKWKHGGTIHFLARIISTRELDREESADPPS